MSPQLGLLRFVNELIRNWRELLSADADRGQYRSADIDRVAVMLKADFVFLPVLRFLGLDPVPTLASQPELFHRMRKFCLGCDKQMHCSDAADSAVCSNIGMFRRWMGRCCQG